MNALIVTGERSAENYARLLIEELNKISKFEFFSVCSDIISSKTIKIADYRDISIIGAKEAFGVLKRALNILRLVKETIINNNIELVVLLDFPEFNLKVAKFASKLGVKVVYYITPQVWAWRGYRINQLKKYVDLIIPILPFERTFFNVKGVRKIRYLGHPIIDILHDKVGKHDKSNIILIMPGSRKSEIEFNYKVMFEGAKLIKEKYPIFEFVWVYPDHLDSELRDKIVGEFGFVRLEHDPYVFMDKAYFGILKSGTTTLEAAVYGLPMVVVYKLSRFSYYLGRLFIRNIKYISLPNLIADDKIVNELIEDKATPESILINFEDVHLDQSRRKDIVNRLKGVSSILGEYPVTPRIAKEIVSVL